MDYRSYRYGRRGSMRSSMKTPLIWLTSGNERQRRPTYLFLEMTRAFRTKFRSRITAILVHCVDEWGREGFQSQYRQLHNLQNYMGQEAPFLGCIHAIYRQHVRHKQLLDTFQGKVLYPIWSPESLIRVTQLLPSLIICFSHSLVVPSWYLICLEERKLRVNFTVGMSSPHSWTWYSIILTFQIRHLSNRRQIDYLQSWRAGLTKLGGCCRCLGYEGSLFHCWSVDLGAGGKYSQHVWKLDIYQWTAANFWRQQSAVDSYVRFVETP